MTTEHLFVAIFLLRSNMGLTKLIELFLSFF